MQSIGETAKASPPQVRVRKNQRFRWLILCVVVILGLGSVFTATSFAGGLNGRGTVGFRPDRDPDATDPRPWAPVAALLLYESEDLWVCLDPSKDSPRNAPTEVVKTVTDPKLAYISWLARNTREDAQGSALYLLLSHKYSNDLHRVTLRENQLKKTKWKWDAYEKARADYESQANKFAGPYQASVAMVGKSPGNESGVITNVGVTTGSGNWYPGAKAKLSLVNAKFLDGNTTKTVTTASQPLEFDYRADAAGKVTATLDVPELPPVTLNIYRTANVGANKDIQEVMRFGGVSSAKKTAEIGIQTQWQPKIVTNLANNVLQPEAEVVDTATITGGKPLSVVTGKFEFYLVDHDPRKSPYRDEKPFAIVPFKQQLDKNGTAKNITAKARLPKNISRSQFITVVASISKGEGNEPYRAPWGEAPETGVVITGTVTTKASVNEAKLGDGISDNWRISGIFQNFDDKKLKTEIVPVRYGPISASPDGKCPETASAWKTAKSVPVAIAKEWNHGELLAETATTQPDEPGCYSFGGKVTVTSENGDVITQLVHEPGNPSETFVIKKPIVDAGIPNEPWPYFIIGILTVFGLTPMLIRVWQ